MINLLNLLDFVFLLKLRIKREEKPTFLVTHVGSCGVWGEGEGKRGLLEWKSLLRLMDGSCFSETGSLRRLEADLMKANCL